MAKKQKFVVVVVYGEYAAKSYMNGGFEGMRSSINRGEGQLVKREFNTESERRAYIQGMDDADGWLGAAVLDAEDVQKHPRIIKSLL